ncbi:Uncharacterised protein [Chlamydia trachomatis]|nr:Uncharacterised protein [Chlamydia trachomatis]
MFHFFLLGLKENKVIIVIIMTFHICITHYIHLFPFYVAICGDGGASPIVMYSN